MASFLLWQQSLSSSHSFIPARQFQSPAPEITVDPKWLQNVLRPLHQQGSQIGIDFLTDVHLGLALAGVSPSWLQSQIKPTSRLLPKRCGASSLSKKVSAISVPTRFTCFSSNEGIEKPAQGRYPQVDRQ
jgi:hypothetical protein